MRGEPASLMKKLDLDFQEVLDSAPDGILLADRSGRILLVNRQVEQLFGYRQSQLRGQAVEILVPERLRERHATHRIAYDTHPAARPMGLGLDLIARHKDGHEFAVEISLSPLVTSDGPAVMAIIRDMTERRRMQEERNALALELQMERERHRIGMDLHDGIMQAIYATSLRLELALDEEGPEQLHLLERAIDGLHDVSRDIRSYIFDLRPRQFGGDIVIAITNLGEEFRQNTQIETAVRVSPDLPPLSQERGLSLYLIAHEALSNVRKHAKAKQVMIELSARDGLYSLEIADDGLGFDPEATVPEDHFGLRNMATRAYAAGATLIVESAPGKGTRTSLTIPLSEVTA